ncbi:hypothetical protein Prudu_013498 [Prunus dulcis]|uniref:Reverse transcriptase domain-containing protein n=1 Tax=Prunus dulcis TaxID=3755 RepID=A0A4Y1RF52_PRUDU|nr:hypothetical protein Prudu_013498 [Prunus dulcis]
MTEYLDKFVIVFIDDILVYSKTQEEHEKHVRDVFEILRNEKLFAKFKKCELWLSQVALLGDIISGQGIVVHPGKVEAMVNWSTPTSVGEVLGTTIPVLKILGSRCKI